MRVTTLTARLWGIGLVGLLTSITASSAVMSAEVAGPDFLKDEQLVALSDKVKTISTAYTLEYASAEKPSEPDRRTSIKEWMTKDHYRSEIVMELFAKGKPTVTKKEMQIASGGKTYVFNALEKVLTISEGNSPSYVNFSNPLSFKHAMVSRLLLQRGVGNSLSELTAADYPARVGAMMQVMEDKPNEVTITEKGNPQNATKFVMRFASAERVMPESIDGWGQMMLQAADGTITKEVKRLGVFKVIDKGTVRIGGTAFVYPKQVDWLDGTGTRVACVIRVTKVALNETINEDLFAPDYSIADRIDDNTKKK